MKAVRKAVMACALLGLASLAIARKEPPKSGFEPATVRRTAAPEKIMNEKAQL
jgi:hypothetical protein